MNTDKRVMCIRDIGAFPKRATVARLPLRTLNEFALEIGIKRQSLVGFMRGSSDAPKPRSKVCDKHYYVHAELRAWWATLKGSKA